MSLYIIYMIEGQILTNCSVTQVSTPTQKTAPRSLSTKIRCRSQNSKKLKQEFAVKVNRIFKTAKQETSQVQAINIFSTTAKVLSNRVPKKKIHSLQSESILKHKRPNSFSRYTSCFTQFHGNQLKKAKQKKIIEQKQGKKIFGMQDKKYMKIYEQYKKDNEQRKKSGAGIEEYDNDNCYEQYYQELIEKGKQFLKKEEKKMNKKEKIGNKSAPRYRNIVENRNYKKEFEILASRQPDEIKVDPSKEINLHLSNKFLKKNPIHIRSSLEQWNKGGTQMSRFKQNQQKIIEQASKNKLSMKHTQNLVEELNDTYMKVTQHHRYRFMRKEQSTAVK